MSVKDERKRMGGDAVKTEYKLREIELYDNIARKYDFPCDEASKLGFETACRLIHNFTSNFRNAAIMDLGCGTGRYFDAIQGYERIVGVDISREMLKVAKERSGGKRIDLIRADAFHLPFVGDKIKFDLIISIGLLGVHVPVTEALLLGLRQILKDNGSLVFTTNILLKHWRAVVKRKFYELLGKKPDPRFPIQPYAETSYLLKRRLMRSGYIPEKVEKVKFAAEGYIVVARAA
jgi:SAM-dependent methyltransferase